MTIIRTRWAAIGAAVAVTLGAGGIGIVSATQPSGAVAFVPITPCRVMDTRTEFNVGPKTSPVGPGEIYTVNTTTGNTGNCTDIPTTATGVSLNVTALDATQPTFLTIWATGDEQPDASSLNPVPGQPPTPNAVTTGINANGQFDIFNLQGSVQVLADINGYYTDHNHDDRYYTENEVDTALAGKANAGDTYTKSQSDATFVQAGDAAAPPSTQSRWTGCNGPSMNTPDDEDDTFSLTNNNRGYIGSQTNGAEFYCALELPEGASMNGFRALLRDEGPSGAGQGLARCFLQHMALTGVDAGQELTLFNTVAATGLLGSNGTETPFLVDDLMPTIPVDNANFLYFIKCDVFSGGTTTVGQLGVYAAQVRYNISAVPGTNN